LNKARVAECTWIVTPTAQEIIRQIGTKFPDELAAILL
jgi:hypothetical protein